MHHLSDLSNMSCDHTSALLRYKYKMAASQPTRTHSISIFEHFVPLLFYVLLFSCTIVDSSDVVDCFSERFNSVTRWNISINGQEELDRFVDNITSINDDADRCIQLFLTGKSYNLRIMGIKLGNDGGLVMVGVADPLVTINCVVNASYSLEDLRNILQPLTHRRRNRGAMAPPDFITSP